MDYYLVINICVTLDFLKKKGENYGKKPKKRKISI